MGEDRDEKTLEKHLDLEESLSHDRKTDDLPHLARFWRILMTPSAATADENRLVLYCP